MRHVAVFSLFFCCQLALKAELSHPNPLHTQNVYSESLNLLLSNLERGDVSKGAVIASPSKASPDYFYHWTRDAALTHEGILLAYEHTQDSALKAKLKSLALDWIEFEKIAQKNSETAVGDLGEPRFHVDGRVNTADWGRPQNDGPAARAMTMSLWALKFLEAGDRDYVTENLYRAEFPATTLIKKDLEYVAHKWREPSFDLWEEVKGLHFYTLAIQRRALLLGAQLASRLGDKGGALFYATEAEKIKLSLERFLNAGKPYIVATLDQSSGWTHKTSNLDIAVIIAANHAFFEDEFFLKQRHLFTNTLAILEEKFHSIYPINKDPSLATSMGRYPEDVYDGVGFSGANPWFLATHAAAEYYCKISKLAANSEVDSNESEALLNKGRSFLARTLKHREQASGEMSEQFSRHNGFLTGASHLTWSYASYIAAYLACY